ncbi:hypothetical protein ACLI4U_13250 [Natrialbaceae archaeon A-CW2]
MSSRDQRAGDSIGGRLRSQERDRKAVIVGMIVTSISTILFFVLPEAFAGTTTSLMYLQWFGGVVGGSVAGYLTSNHGSGFVTGTKAAVYGLGLAYLGAIVLYFLYSAVVMGVLLPPGLAIVAVLLYYAIPLLFSHLFGGLIAGGMVHRIRMKK